MLSDELLKKIKKIEINTRRMIDNSLSGKYRSHFKGHGVQFKEHRQYAVGDDIRHIDWKVSARSREPMIKKYEEERELNALLLVDLSGSESFGSDEKKKSEVLAEVSAMLSFAASQTGDNVGVILFSDRIEKTIPPRRGKQHVLRIIRDLLELKPKGKGTNITLAIDTAFRVLKHTGIVFILSDFLTDENFQHPLRRLTKKHDVVAIWINDERERQVPEHGYGAFLNPETGEEVYVDLGSYRFKKWFKEQAMSRVENIKKIFRGSRVEVVEMQNSGEYADEIVKFFRRRKSYA